MVQTNKTQSLCSCNHLTSFAILMDFGDSLAVYDGRNGFPKKWQARLLDLLTTISCVISIICLLLCLTIFTLFRYVFPDCFHLSVFIDLYTILGQLSIGTCVYVYCVERFCSCSESIKLRTWSCAEWLPLAFIISLCQRLPGWYALKSCTQ